MEGYHIWKILKLRRIATRYKILKWLHFRRNHLREKVRTGIAIFRFKKRQGRSLDDCLRSCSNSGETLTQRASMTKAKKDRSIVCIVSYRLIARGCILRLYDN